MSEYKGINLGELDVQVEQRLKFKPNMDVLNGICMGAINRIELIETENPLVDKDGKPSNYEYKGLKTTSLLIEFKQLNFDAKDSSERFHVHVEKPIVSIKNDGTKMDQKSFDDLLIQMYSRLQHIVNELDAAKLAPLSTRIKDLTISVNDDAQSKAAKFKKMFEHFLKQITGKPEEPRCKVPAFIKLVADYKTASRYEIPTYVRRGFYQVIREGVECTLELEPNESIELIKSGSKGTKNMNATGNATTEADAKSVKSVDDIVASVMGGSKK